MFKKTIAIVATASVIFGAIPAFAAPGTDLKAIPVIVNGQKVKFPDTEPYISAAGNTMVPVRFVSEKLGADVKWDNTTQTVLISYNGKNIRMSVGSKEVSVDGVVSTLDTSAEIYDTRTMVPLRFVSEVLGSEVIWDQGAHSVRVTDAAYKAKVDSGEVELDPWGRELSQTQDTSWYRLTDLEPTNFYSFYSQYKTSRTFITPKYARNDIYKDHADVLANKIRSYYEAQLNVDYRTINETDFVNAFMKSASGKITMDAYLKSEWTKVLKSYVAWVKKNKVIAKGYADPEPMAIFTILGPIVWYPVHFKFMILSSVDTAQTFADNWNVSSNSESFKLKTGVWYNGYSVISMTSVGANDSWSDKFGLRTLENMFSFDMFFYDYDK
ncbi:copper amine oxidase N-terminal domain-containing protein [Cohnella fermenti]|uniref:Copper amine oxidase N-terminal domain-containing protein n=1 Tax=Cohnella fermenti TaxID=2565925 RepID=A0A4S4C3E2_9BACL|nr:copper amine oxidase N-terminal domain-containing protein [Cohnella fermenti]THF82258.1 copper amine oxidase N-terminal domain-containing protein [Cohnella fermenti]